ncbi:hypothetical protein [Roseateles flavus]|uniref:Uncharacterized protein n=1 Tax=Roseateles flavus TaxID=3149041 RepID=A0ABV0GKH5_9BURK
MAEDASRHWLAKLLIVVAGALGGAGIYGYLLYDFEFLISVILLLAGVFMVALSAMVDGYLRKNL